jgi:hypothetical protein
VVAGEAGRDPEGAGLRRLQLQLYGQQGSRGVDPSDKKRFILALGEGSFDIAAFLAELKRIGYKGPVGHQFYSIPGEPEVNLKKAMDAWRKLQPRRIPNIERRRTDEGQSNNGRHSTHATRHGLLSPLDPRPFC